MQCNMMWKGIHTIQRFELVDGSCRRHGNISDMLLNVILGMLLES